jgi:hypothetical protein
MTPAAAVFPRRGNFPFFADNFYLLGASPVVRSPPALARR